MSVWHAIIHVEAHEDVHFESAFIILPPRQRLTAHTVPNVLPRTYLVSTQVSPGLVMDEVVKYREIYPDNKGRHFKKLQEDSGFAYDEMLFFDDCNWGDNCRDVEWACPGVVTVKTPEGLTPEKWAEVSTSRFTCCR